MNSNQRDTGCLPAGIISRSTLVVLLFGLRRSKWIHTPLRLSNTLIKLFLGLLCFFSHAHKVRRETTSAFVAIKPQIPSRQIAGFDCQDKRITATIALRFSFRSVDDMLNITAGNPIDLFKHRNIFITSRLSNFNFKYPSQSHLPDRIF